MDSFWKKKVVETTQKTDKAKEIMDIELAKLLQLKESATGGIPLRYSDDDLLAFLRARSLNVEEAEKLMKLDHNLKRFLQLDEFIRISESPDLAITKQYSASGYIGFDKEGSLVRILNPGLSDIKGFVRSVSTIDNFRQLLWYVEKDQQLQKQENRKTGRKKLHILYIVNLENLSMTSVMYKPVLDSGMVALKLLQDHYHDIIKAVYFINVPAFFSSILKLFRPVIQESLYNKIRIFDDDSWKEELPKQIDADLLPVQFGGNRVDCNGDPMCRAILGYGGEIPEELYSNNFLPFDDPTFSRVVVPAGATLNYRFPVKEIGSVLRFHVQAKENDIGLGVFCEKTIVDPKDADKKRRNEDISKLEQITPIVRSQCHVCPEVGQTTLWFTGTLVVHLDNSYSWMSSKEILFKVAIDPPSQVQNNLIKADSNLTSYNNCVDDVN